MVVIQFGVFFRLAGEAQWYGFNFNTIALPSVP